MMEWFFWPTRVSYANDPVGTALVGIVALLFGVGLGARLPRGRLRTALWVLPPEAGVPDGLLPAGDLCHQRGLLPGHAGLLPDRADDHSQRLLHGRLPPA